MTKPLLSTFDPNGVYSNKTSIDEIHKFCLECFDKLDTGPVKSKINALQNRLNTEVLYVIDRRKLEMEIQDLLSIPEPQVEKERFIEDTKPILEEWPTVPIEERYMSIRAYLQICQKYKLPVNMSREPSKYKTCPYCNTPYYEDDDQLICFPCNRFYDSIIQGVEYNDIGRVNTSNGSSYEEESFDDAKMCYQGKQVCNIPPDLFARIDAYVENAKINRAILRPTDMIDIWKEIKYHEYRNVNLFMSMWINYPLQDLTTYDTLLEYDNRTFMQCFEELKAEGYIDRDSAPNGYYRLYIFCQYRNIPCDVVALKMPDGRKTLLELDSVARKVFERMGRTFRDTA